MTRTADLTRRAVRRAARLAAYALLPKFTTGAIVVARRPGEVLLVRKRTGGPEWGFPAGYLKYGERLVRAAARELAEETGVRADVGEEHLVRSYRQPWMAHFDHLYLIAADGEPHVDDAVEIAEARWWPVGDLPPLAREAALALTEVPGLLTREPPYSKRAGSPAP